MTCSSIIVDSSKRTRGTVNDFTINYKYPIEAGVYRLVYVSVPYTIKTIDDRNNRMKVNGTEITLTSGNYTAAELKTEIQTRLNTVVSGFTVSDNDYVLTISNSSSSFTLDFTGYDLTAETLGYESKLYPSSTSHTGTSMLNLRANSNLIGVRLDNHTRVRGNGDTGYTFVIPETSVKNEYISYKSEGHFSQVIDVNRDTTKLEVRLVDKNENLIDVKGVNWYFILQRI